MAFELKKEDDKEENPQGQPLLTSGQGATLSAGGGGGPGTDEKPIAPTKDPIGQGVADVGKYLDVNQEKARNLAGQIGGFVSGDITQAKEGLGSAENQFKADVNKGTVGFNQEVFDKGQSALINPNATAVVNDQLAKKAYDEKMKTASAPQNTSGGGFTFGGLAADTGAPAPTAPQYTAGSADKFMQDYGEQFKQQYNATYGGPNDINSQQYFLDAQQKAQEAKRTAELRNTEIGRQELIARALNPDGRINRGVLALDQAILAKDQVAMDTLNQAAAGSPELQDKLEALKSLGAQLVDSAKKTTAETRGKFREGFNISTETKEIQDAYELLKADVAKDLKKREEDLKKMTKQEGVDPLAFFNRQYGSGLNQFNTATKDDIERLRVLEELTGLSSGGFTQNANIAGTASQFTDASGAFDEAGYKNAVEQRLKQRMSAEQAKKEAEKAAAEAKATAQGQAIGTVVGAGIGTAVGGPVGGVVGGIVGGAIGGAICFDGDTLITLEDGSSKAIKEIQLGDKVKLGGTVTSVSQHLFNDMIYAYPTKNGFVYVTGYHAVKEDGIWKRVKDARLGILVPLEDKEVNVVYSISNEKHRLEIDGQIFADDEEINNGKLYNAQEAIEMLNYLEGGPIWV